MSVLAFFLRDVPHARDASCFSWADFCAGPPRERQVGAWLL